MNWVYNMPNETKLLDELRSKVKNLLHNHEQRSLSLRQLLDALELQGEGKTALKKVLRLMLEDGELLKTGRERYGLPARLGYLTGTLEGNRRGYAFLKTDGEAEDVFIGARHLRGAVHGDRVMVRLIGSGKGRRREGEVTGVLERGGSRLVGRLEKHNRRLYYVIPDDRRFFSAIEVSHRHVGSAAPGDKVGVEIIRWPEGGKLPAGRVIERLGRPGEPGVEQRALEHQFELPRQFPEAVLKSLERLPGEEQIALIAGEQKREDLRNLLMVTIDDEQAKDFDDAVSLETVPGGGCRLGVHIADVSEYVAEQSPLDREAFRRGTSIYLVDRVIPMLPPLLSEQLCCLQAGRDRLAVSVLMEFDAGGELTAYRFFPSLINVAQRLTYRQVESYLTGKTDAGNSLAPGVAEMLAGMDRLAETLRRRRERRGSLDLDIPEPYITLGPEGEPVSVEKRRTGRAESLIEEFMIRCNEAIAAYFSALGIPFLYRVHAVPAEEKLAALQGILELLGISPFKQAKLSPRRLNELLESARGRENEILVRYLVLRSLPQARYSAVNEGHFGLASPCYTHFTAPIRRYPDLVIHRILKEYLVNGDIVPGRQEQLKSRLPAVAIRSSERERLAMEAERASEDLFKAKYMKNKVGEVYSGIISGVTNFGVFVELENTVEGMVHLSDLDDDYYVYHEKQAAVIGERNRKIYRLGSKIVVRVQAVNAEAGRISFVPA